jgi:hypothetical protein
MELALHEFLTNAQPGILSQRHCKALGSGHMPTATTGLTYYGRAYAYYGRPLHLRGFKNWKQRKRALRVGALAVGVACGRCLVDSELRSFKTYTEGLTGSHWKPIGEASQGGNATRTEPVFSQWVASCTSWRTSRASCFITVMEECSF